MAALETEVTLELLTDLSVAVRDVMRTIVPGLPIDVRVIAGEEPGIIIKVKQPTTVYPAFVNAKVVLRPTDHYRRILGLPERGT